MGGPADTRELPGLAITKVAVGPMDNNAYLLRCTQTGELALIDAANDRRRFWTSSATGCLRRSSPRTSTGITTRRYRRCSRRPAPGR